MEPVLSGLLAGTFSTWVHLWLAFIFSKLGQHDVDEMVYVTCHQAFFFQRSMKVFYKLMLQSTYWEKLLCRLHFIHFMHSSSILKQNVKKKNTAYIVDQAMTT